MMRSKYGNRKVTKVSRDGKSETFDSQKEYLRHLVLLDMQKKGEIEGLLRQPRYRLIVNEKLICAYVGDWFYMEDKDRGQRWNTGIRKRTLHAVVEDAKGYQTPDFKIKWALAKALHPEIEWRLS